MLSDVLSNLNLPADHIQMIESLLPPKCTVADFSELLKGGGSSKSKKVFSAMKKSQFESMNAAIKKLVPK